jgi:hypothetical protein
MSGRWVNLDAYRGQICKPVYTIVNLVILALDRTHFIRKTQMPKVSCHLMVLLKRAALPICGKTRLFIAISCL